MRSSAGRFRLIYSGSIPVDRNFVTIMNSSTFMVTGGCGFIASHLISQLLAGGATRVIALDSLDYGRVENLPSPDPRLQIVQHRLGRESHCFLKEILAGVDYVFHLAAEKHNQSLDNPQKVIDANIAGTHALLQAAVECGVKKIVFTSSLYAYGRMQGVPYLESELPQPRTVYGISKLTGEHLCALFHQRHGLPFVCLRYLFVYGPRQYTNLGYKSVIVKNFQRLLAGEPPIINGDGRQTLDYVYVEDAVKATLRAMLSPLNSEVLNVATGSGVCVIDLIASMQEVAGTLFTPVFAPADVTHGSCRVGNPAKLKFALEFVPATPLLDGLKATFDWLKQARST
jgi:UDP-glucose 4-epimerase